jgi:hypothetical protein
VVASPALVGLLYKNIKKARKREKEENGGVETKNLIYITYFDRDTFVKRP